MAVATSVAAAVPGTLAAFVDNATATGGAISSTAMTTPTAPTANQTPGTGKVALAWPAANLADGTAPAGYRVLRYDAATGGTVGTACTTTTDRTCSVDPSSTKVWYAVQSTYGGAWESAVSPRTSLTADLTGPTVAFTEPDDGESVLFSTLAGSVASECQDTAAGTSTSGRVACGTASDTGGVATVEYQLQRSQTVLGSTAQWCWNGSATWSSGACAAYRTASTAGSTWWVPGARASAYAGVGTYSYTLTVRATDVYGNVTTRSVSFRTLPILI